MSLHAAPVEQLNRGDLVRDLGRRCVNGVVIFEATAESVFYSVLEEADFPYCSVFKNDGRHTHRFLAVDTEDVGLQAARRLVALGHQRIGVLATPAAQEPTQLKLRGYKRALTEANLDFDEALVFEMGEEESATEFAQEATEDILRVHPEVTALFSMSENIVIGALHALHWLEISIPRAVSLVSCGDFLQSRYLFPPLTVVEIPFARAGYLAMRKVHHLLLGTPDPAVNDNVILKGRLIDRASTGPPRKGPLRHSRLHARRCSARRRGA